MYANRTTIVKDLRERYPDYTYDETKQAKLLADVKAGKDATEFICRNLSLVCYAVDKYFFGSDKEDAVTEGITTLLHAAELYDKKDGTKFSTYAVRAIMFAMQRKEKEDDPGLNIPGPIRTAVGIYRSDRKGYDAMTDSEIAKAFGIAERNVPYLRELVHTRTVYLEAPTRNTEEGNEDVGTLSDLVEDPKGERYQDELMYREDLNKILSEAKLSPRELDVVKKRFGVDCDHKYKQIEIAKEQHVTSEYIRQIEARAMKKLRWAVKGNNYFNRSWTDRNWWIRYY